MRSPNNNSFGPGFNGNNGGVYASTSLLKCCMIMNSIFSPFTLVQWDDSGIAVYFFPRGSVPSDLTAGSPDPSGWGIPQARWPAASCNPFQFFSQHSMIFDTTLWSVTIVFNPIIELRLIGAKFLVAIGQAQHGILLDKIRAAHNRRDSRPVKLSYKPAERHFQKPVG